MKVLITGGGGFIGTNLIEGLTKKGFSITILDNFSRETSVRNREHVKKNYPEVQVIAADVRNFDAVKEAVANKDAIIHAAAQVAVTTSVTDPILDKETNIDGTLNVLEAARKYGKAEAILFFSTNKVYGDNVNKVPLEELKTRYDFSGELKGKGIPENFSIDAKEHTPYGCSKLAADLYMQDYAQVFKMPTVVNRCSCMYGMHQYGNEDQGWLAHFVISAIRKKPISIYGDGKQVRDALFASDVAALCIRQIEKISEAKGNVFNIGGGPKNIISVNECLSEISRNTALPAISHHEWRPADQKVYYSDIRKAENLLKWAPKISPKEGIKELYGWAKNIFC